MASGSATFAWPGQHDRKGIEMGFTSIWHWIIVLAVVLILFARPGKISGIMGDFGKGLRSFKDGVKSDEAEAEEAAEGEAVEKPAAKKPFFRNFSSAKLN